jgi:hypothetical protein
METFSPVVWIDILQVILALVPLLDLRIQQMDVKGAYLNSVLRKTIFMREPKGCKDGTGHICQLIKTLYGLKQSRREWNRQLDEN